MFSIPYVYPESNPHASNALSKSSRLGILNESIKRRLSINSLKRNENHHHHHHHHHPRDESEYEANYQDSEHLKDTAIKPYQDHIGEPDDVESLPSNKSLHSEQKDI
ncbi:hypothetical protein MOUN0_N06480 [Monosporozyma unispora]|nr:hypothetical protein C6P44_003116 [Kazachstania unispora]